MSTLPPLKLTVPAAVSVELLSSVIVPLLKFSVEPAAALNAPWLSPPPLKLIVPLWTLSAPSLLKVIPIVVVAVPPLLRTVPALLNTTAPPNALYNSRSSWKSASPELWLFHTAPLPERTSAPLKLIVPLLLSVRGLKVLMFGPLTASVARSEERRVGNECSALRVQYRVTITVNAPLRPSDPQLEL